MQPEYINSIVTLLVGGIALFVYWLTKRNEKRNAATIILMDVRHAEQVVLSILEKGAVDTVLKNIITENNWNKYKHLFASDFSQDDFSAFNRFFDSCIDISEARKSMLAIFNAGLISKAEYIQQLLLNIDNPASPQGQEARAKIINKANQESHVFDPDDPKGRIFRPLQLMGRLSNTVAFEKLRKIAGVKA
ncbi:MAG: hypothetical protein ACOY33_10285 [Pseudomonadota bacterium]